MLPDNSGGNPTEDQKDLLFQPAIQELRTRHQKLDIKINYVRAPYNQTRAMMLSAFAGINQSSTMMGGWELAIPQKSQNKDLAWELLTIMVNPKIISPWLEQNGFLPTQKNLGSGPQSIELSQTIPYYDKMMSMIPTGHSRSSVSEYPQIADNVREAIEDVYYGIKEPKQALDDAAAKSAKALGR